VTELGVKPKSDFMQETASGNRKGKKPKIL
jgi:hypothetical protein